MLSLFESKLSPRSEQNKLKDRKSSNLCYFPLRIDLFFFSFVRSMLVSLLLLHKSAQKMDTKFRLVNFLNNRRGKSIHTHTHISMKLLQLEHFCWFCLWNTITIWLRRWQRSRHRINFGKNAFPIASVSDARCFSQVIRKDHILRYEKTGKRGKCFLALFFCGNMKM